MIKKKINTEKWQMREEKIWKKKKLIKKEEGRIHFSGW